MIPAQAVEAILIAHQRQDTSSCLCGWSELGKSHPGHQAAMLHTEGFGLIEPVAAQLIDMAEREEQFLAEGLPYKQDRIAAGAHARAWRTAATTIARR